MANLTIKFQNYYRRPLEMLHLIVVVCAHKFKFVVVAELQKHSGSPRYAGVKVGEWGGGRVGVL